MSSPPAHPASETPAAAEAFPDCWLAYGATNEELSAYGVEWPQRTNGLAVVAAAQASLAVGLVAVIALTMGVGQAVAGGVLAAVLASLLVSVLRASATIRRIEARQQGFRVVPALGSAFVVPWTGIAEIAAVEMRGRLGIGLRWRPGVGGISPRFLTPLRRLVAAGFDALASPEAGDAELLARVLLRYCFDPKARRRLPSDERDATTAEAGGGASGR
jgi:hypothetical protein